MKIVKVITLVSLALLLLGGVNMLIIGLFNYNLINAIFVNSVVIRIVYSVIGISALWLACYAVMERERLFSKTGERRSHTPANHQ